MLISGATGAGVALLLMPPPDYFRTMPSIAQLNQINAMVNGWALAAVILVYAIGFVALSLWLRRLRAQLRLPGIRLGVVVAALVAAATAFTAYKITVVSPNAFVLLDALTVVAFGGGYVLALFLAFHYSKFSKKGKR